MRDCAERRSQADGLAITTTIATVRAFKTKLTNAEDDIQQTSLHVCSTWLKRRTISKGHPGNTATPKARDKTVTLS